MNLTTQSKDSPSPGPTPRAAATIVLLRGGAQGAEVLLTVRPEQMRFMGGATVFPGGALAPADLDPRWEGASALTRAAAAASAPGGPDPKLALGLRVAALREAFEEVGLLLATGDGRGMSRRDAADPGTWMERCLQEGIVLRTDLLVPAGRWITPVGSKVRFDAHFFMAVAPEGWEPRPDPREVAACRWQAPAAALDGMASGEALMAPPTIEMLQRLAAHTEVADMLEDLAGRGIGGDKPSISAPLGPGVHVVLAPNPGLMTGPGTNTYVVGTGPRAVIDPAVADADFLNEILFVASGSVASILITHRHPDHTGGVAALRAKTGAPVRAFGNAEIDGPMTALADGEELALGDFTLRALHTPGHSGDHLCFFEPARRLLFSGDNVLGEGTAVIAPPDGDMGDYLESLEKMRSLEPEWIYPGHFRPRRDARAVIDEYIAHRHEREGAIVAVLAGGEATIDSIVERLYADVDPSLHPLARLSVQAHLELAARAGRVFRRGDNWMLTSA